MTTYILSITGQSIRYRNNITVDRVQATILLYTGVPATYWQNSRIQLSEGKAVQIGAYSVQLTEL